jgi:allantoate deiminase
MHNDIQRAQKILARINELATVSEDETNITRRFGTAAFVAGREKVLQWMIAAGLQVRTDNIGNIRAVYPSPDNHAKTLVIASHIDTVVNAGKFDGPLGVLMGLDLIEQLAETKTVLPFHIELVAFCDEEGVRFHTTYLGSKVLAGSFDRETLDRKDEEGITLKEVIWQLNGDLNKLNHDAIPADRWLGYFEIHIEQGPVLYEKNIPVGIVTAIAGQVRMEVIFKGHAGHAGTVPMGMRNDALCCAAEYIVELEQFAEDHPSGIVATTGRLNIRHAAGNVIPGEVICSLDLRSASHDILYDALKKIRVLSQKIAARRDIQVEWRPVQESVPVACSKPFNALLAAAIKEAGYDIISMVSGAGHDAVPVSAIAPVAMLFVRCFKGISHHPLEDVELKDIAAAVKVSDNFIQQLAGSPLSKPVAHS